MTETNLKPAPASAVAADPRMGSKEYFAAPGTVATWWREEKWPEALKPYFEAQLQTVLTLDDWKGKRVLDAGTGFGRFARALAQAGACVFGVDISSEMLAMARSRSAQSSITWNLGDVERLPFADDSFDTVVCAEVFMHIPDPRAAVLEFARVVRPGGKVIFGINNRYSLSCLLYGLQMSTTLKLYHWLKKKPLMPYHSNTVRQAHQWLRDAGLVLESEAGVGILHPTAISLPGGRLPILPQAGFSRALTWELRHNLGRGWMRRICKAFIVCARKP